MKQRDVKQPENIRRSISQALFFSIVMLLVGCAEPSTPVQLPSPAAEDMMSQDYVGLSEAQARDLARGRDTPFRVVTRDGVSLMVTFDFIRGRINADVRDGVVVGYAIEGTRQQTKKVPSAAKTPN